MIIWKQIVGFEGSYEVSNNGFVRSIERYYCTGQYYHKRFLPSKILCVTLDKDGYRKVHLNKGGDKYTFRVGRLVCAAFHPNPDNKPVVNHKNGDVSCDCDWNLEWATQSENILHSYRELHRKPCPNMKGKIGFLSPFSKPLYQKTLDGILVKIWGSMGEAVLAGFSRSRLKAVINGKQEYHKGFKWSR